MNEKYQIEINEFKEQFRDFKNARIVLYGTGRLTATILEGITDYNFVGLMDKDTSRIGELAFGIPIIDKRTAEKISDIVIINTAETYWDVIYERIKDLNVPIYYRNGERAQKKEREISENPYSGLSYQELCMYIKDAEIVSFDFFDTLFVRNVCNPRDVFRLLELWIQDEWKPLMAYTEVRSIAVKRLKTNYSFDELYKVIQEVCGISDELAERIKRKELEIEKSLLSPRKEILKACRSAIADGKEVYIISDMYLPNNFYEEVLSEHNIFISKDHLMLSNVLDLSKQDGSMWIYYADRVLSKKALHIGDDWEADIDKPKKYGIMTYQVPGIWDLLSVSSLKNVRSYICSDYASVIMGCVLRKLFEDPYRSGDMGNIVRIRNNYEMGYCVFAPVVLTFFLWLIQISEQDKIKKLIFMSRDGYFLKEDFDYFCEISGEKKESCYLGISRQLAMSVSVENEEELEEYANMPYSGNIEELFEDRFGIKGVKENVGKTIKDYLKEYLPQIEDHLLRLKRNYMKYVKCIKLDDDCAVVDLGFYGNNQRYLNKFLHKNIPGYYFNANLSEKNVNTRFQKMEACFQKKEDHTGKSSYVLKKQIYLESFLTAPYGMVKAVDENGNFICADRKKNQEHFKSKEEINRGVKQFISDYIRLFGQLEIKMDIEFIDWFYGFCFSGVLEFDEAVKAGFYNDNAMMNRIESMLFY